MAYDQGLYGLMIAVATGIILSLAVLLLVHRMIDGVLAVGPGLAAILLVVPTMVLAIKPPHPAVPWVIMVVVIALMLFFPFAEHTIGAAELRSIRSNQLARSYAAVQARADNFAAKFELARMLYDRGFRAAAIQLAETTLASLTTERDEVRNQSVRDVFHKDEQLLRRWRTEAPDTTSYPCPSCGRVNPPALAFCAGCGRPHLLDLLQGRDVRPRIVAKLVVAFAAVALFIPASVAAGLATTGLWRYVSFILCFVGVAALLMWLFRSPQIAKARR